MKAITKDFLDKMPNTRFIKTPKTNARMSKQNQPTLTGIVDSIVIPAKVLLQGKKKTLAWLNTQRDEALVKEFRTTQAREINDLRIVKLEATIRRMS